MEKVTKNVRHIKKGEAEKEGRRKGGKEEGEMDKKGK